MKKMILAVMLFAAINGYAAQTNTGCQGNCPSTAGDTTNQGGIGYGGQGGNGGSAIAGAVGIGVGVGGTGGSGGSGGAGGTGGAGGSVVGSGNSSATGGAVVGSGNSKQDQSQGQHQVANGGNAKQSQSSRNDNRSSASNTNSNENSGNNAQTNVSVTGDSVNYQAARIPVATAYAPNIAPTALCALGVSAGGQGMSFGFSIGGSYIDTNCQNLEQVRTAAAVLGDKETAAEMMCGISEAYREARDRSGKPCGKAKSLAATDEKIAMTAAKKPEYTDPIVRARLGLPPLK